jgi:hypothetical protein
MDMLTQMALLDFMPLFTKLPWTTQMVAPFLKMIFQNQADMIEPNLVVLGACVHSEDASQFDVLAKNYMAPLANTLR